MVSELVGGETGSFHTTQWNIVLTSAQTDTSAAGDALAQLCQRYWPPLYIFLRRRGRSPDDAKDMVQEFFLHMIEERAFARASPDRGRFRNFLLGAFTRFLASEFQRVKAQKRGGSCQFLSLDVEDEEARIATELTTAATPERAFEESWAVTVVEHAFRQLADTAKARGRSEVFAAVRPYITGEGQSDSYIMAAAALGLTENGFKTLVHRFRREFGATLRREVLSTLSDPADLDQELQYLRSMLADILS